MTLRTVLVGFALLSLSTGGVRPAQSLAAGYGESLDLTVVQVPVQVLRDGEPVRGLTAADFEVFDDGVPRQLTSFEQVDLAVGAAAAGAPAATGPAGAPTTGRSLLVLFDLAYSPPHQLARAARGIERMVREQLHPADRVAIGLYTVRTGVQLVVGFTTDRAQALGALAVIERILEGKPAVRGEAAANATPPPPADEDERERLARLSSQVGPAAALALAGAAWEERSRPVVPPALWRVMSADLGDALDDGDEPPPGMAPGLAATTVAALAESIEEQAQALVLIDQVRRLRDSFAETVTLLRGVEGQKQLLLLSRGFPDFVLTDAALAPVGESLFAAFRRNGWQIQAFDVGGVPDPFGGRTHALGAPGSPAPGVGFANGTLLYLADGTGGTVFENFADLGDGTAQLLARSAVTYVLTFTVADLPVDGRYHRLRVRLRGDDRGLRVVHREGYYASQPVAERSPLERRLDVAERLLGDEVGGTLEAAALATPVEAAGDAGRISFFVEVPGAQLLPLGGGERRTLRLQAFALDGANLLVDALAHEVTLDLDKLRPVLAAGGLRVHGTLRAAPGEQRVRLAVEDVEGGRSWLATLPVRITAGTEANIGGPLFLDLAGGWVTSRHDATAPYPWRLGGRDVVPRIAPRLTAGERAPLLILLQGAAASGSRLSSRVLTAEGEEARGGALELLSREPGEHGAQRVLAAFAPAGLAPGRYRLQVGVEGGAGGARGEAWFELSADPR